MTQQASSPFTSPANGLSSLGVSSVQAYDVSAMNASGLITIQLSQYCTKGILRVKSSAVNGATTIGVGPALGVNTGNGNSQAILTGAPLTAVTGAGQNFDVNKEIVSDMPFNQIVLSVALGGATTAATINTEFYGTP